MRASSEAGAPEARLTPNLPANGTTGKPSDNGFPIQSDPFFPSLPTEPRQLIARTRTPFAQQPLGERVARAIHLLFGICFMGVPVWLLLPSTPFSPWAFLAFLAAGLGLLWVAFRADRKTVFRVLLLGWV